MVRDMFACMGCMFVWTNVCVWITLTYVCMDYGLHICMYGVHICMWGVCFLYGVWGAY